MHMSICGISHSSEGNSVLKLMNIGSAAYGKALSLFACILLITCEKGLYKVGISVNNMCGDKGGLYFKAL